jgi:hypothetical protein
MVGHVNLLIRGGFSRENGFAVNDSTDLVAPSKDGRAQGMLVHGSG